MGRYQNFKGDPYVKKYYVANNFIGGLNTADADDIVSDAEFRELQNVDLGMQGIIKKRKGFGDVEILNDILEEHVVGIPAGTQRLVKVVRNTANLMHLFSEYKDLADFRLNVEHMTYEFHLLMIIDNKAYLLEINKATKGVGTTETATITDLYTITETIPAHEGLNVANNVEYLDKVYISLGTEVLYIYNIDSKIFEPLVPFKPTPLEVRKIGFNALAESPLTYVDDQGITTKRIAGMFLTDLWDDSVGYMKIPTNGEFKLNVMHTGDTFTPSELDIKFYALDGAGVETDITTNAESSVDLGGVFQFNYRLNHVTSGITAETVEVKIVISDVADPATFVEYIDFYEVGLNKHQKTTNLDLTKYKIVEMDGRLIYYGENMLWFSDLYQFDYIPNLNYVALPISSVDEIVTIKYFRGSHIIFTRDEIWKITGTFGYDITIQPVNRAIGCIAPNSVRSIGNSLVFLSREGLTRLKSSVFQDTLENVDKLDMKIVGEVPKEANASSFLFDEQYIITGGNDYSFYRFYYNIELPKKQHPYVRDQLALTPNLIFSENGELLSIKDGRFYMFGKGYTDFKPSATTDTTGYTYKTIVVTSATALDHPTNVKKLKSIYIKALHSDRAVPLYLTVQVDSNEVLTPTSTKMEYNESGELVYTETTTHQIQLESGGILGKMELGKSVLGELKQAVHKVAVSASGKNIALKIEQDVATGFGILDIGYLFKLGKVKE